MTGILGGLLGSFPSGTRYWGIWSGNLSAVSIADSNGDVYDTESRKITKDGSFSYYKLLDSKSTSTVAVDSSNNWYGAYGGISGRNLIAKWDSAGNLVAQRQLQYGSNYTSFQDLILTSDGSIITSNAYFGTGAAITKITSGFAVSWNQQGITADSSIRIASDSSGSIFFIGSRSNTGAEFGRLTSAGAISWARRTPTTGHQSRGIAVDSAGNPYFLTSESTTATTYLFKYNSSGTLQWQRSINTTTASKRDAVVIDENDNIYIAVGSDTVIKFNSSGTVLWQRKASIAMEGTLAYAGTEGIYWGRTSGNYIIKYPVDGSYTGTIAFGTGTGGDFTISAGTLTVATSSITIQTQTYSSNLPSITITTTTYAVTNGTTPTINLQYI